jgi:hypothetical protein
MEARQASCSRVPAVGNQEKKAGTPNPVGRQVSIAITHFQKAILWLKK